MAKSKGDQKLLDTARAGFTRLEEFATQEELESQFARSGGEASLRARVEGGNGRASENVGDFLISQIKKERRAAAGAERKQTALDLEKAGVLSLRGTKQKVAGGRQRLLANLGKLGVRGADAGRTLGAFESGAITQLQGQAFGQSLQSKNFINQLKQQEFQNSALLRAEDLARKNANKEQPNALLQLANQQLRLGGKIMASIYGGPAGGAAAQGADSALDSQVSGTSAGDSLGFGRTT